jgi:hypothetical protein
MHNAENEHFVVVEVISDKRADAWEIPRLLPVLRREVLAIGICRARRWRVGSASAK